LLYIKNKCKTIKGGLIMKDRVTKIVGIGFLVAALAVPVVVLAQGWGGGHMMGHWGQGSGYMTPNNRGYENFTPDQRTQIEQLDRKFFKETAELNDRLWIKSSELNTLLNTVDPDTKKIKALFKEVNDLRSQLDEKNLEYNLELRKIIPDSRLGGGYGSPQGSHMGGYGSGMMGGGMGSGMMGPGMMMRGYGN
jgi:zinc resistance-associated protein